MEKTRICIFDAVHKANDSRIFYREARSLAKRFATSMIAQSDCQNPESREIKFVFIKPQKNRLLRVLFTDFEIFRKALGQNADIYHFHCPEMLGYAVMLRLLGKKVIYDVHENYTQFILYKHYLPRPARKPLAFLFRHFEDFCCGFFDTIILSDGVYLKRFEKFADKCVLIKNYDVPEDLGAFAGKRRGKKTFGIIYAGSVQGIRGMQNMLNAFAEASARIPQARLSIVGSPESEEYARWLRGYAESLGIGAKTGFLCDGFVDHREIEAHYNAADIGLALYPRIRIHRHKFVTKFFECMKHGVPIIASDFPEWKSFLKKYGCGTTADPKKPAEVAEKIVWLAKNPAARKAMSEAGKKAFREKFNWSSEEKKLFELYEKLVESTRNKSAVGDASR
ncbi:MAG: glycosyltransferase family 4 protein [Candidatus Diapherotrites archaeon]|nr:glycosyltransferase family 4 protein [Candidatus Diapherotrites archaeon]